MYAIAFQTNNTYIQLLGAQGLFLHTIKLFYFSDAPNVLLSLGAPLDPTNLIKGSDVYLECDIKANPPAQRVEWFHNVRIYNIFYVINRSNSAICTSVYLWVHIPCDAVPLISVRSGPFLCARDKTPWINYYIDETYLLHRRKVFYMVHCTITRAGSILNC